MEYKKAVGVIIENDNEEILLMQRGESTDHDNLKWENCGGRLEEDESFEAAAKREVLEELGVQVANLLEVLDYNSEDGTGRIWHSKVFEVKIIGEPQIMEKDLCKEIRWFKREELRNLDLTIYTKSDFDRLKWL